MGCEIPINQRICDFCQYYAHTKDEDGFIEDVEGLCKKHNKIKVLYADACDDYRCICEESEA